MCKKLVYLISFVLVLFLASNAFAADDPSLIIYYSFDEVGDIVVDQSGKGHDGVVVGDITAEPGGKVNGAAKFEGTLGSEGMSYLDLDGPSFPTEDIPTSGMTLAAWIKCENTGGHHAIFNARAGDTTWLVHPEARSNGEFRWLLRAYGGTTIFDVRSGVVPWGEWVHFAGIYDKASAKAYVYNNGELVGEANVNPPLDIAGDYEQGARVGYNIDNARPFTGLMDELFLYKRALSQAEVQNIMQGLDFPYAFNPGPANGAMHEDTWATLSWSPGSSAVSHDVYFGENLDDVKDGTGDTFQGNQTATFLIVGFPGFAYPDGLVPGTTYYWRIDEIEADGTIRKGDIWSFTVPPKTAYNPDPHDGTEFVDLNVELSWTKGFGAMLHTVYFGDNFDDMYNATGGASQGVATYIPGPLELEKVYYWRVDEFDAVDTYKGDVWSFTTPGAVGSLNPANGATDVKQTQVLEWIAADSAASHEVYLGTDKDAVRSADTASPEYKGTRNLGSESYEPGKLAWLTTYYWRVDEVNNVNPDSPWTGPLWSFTTADFLIVDDFEDYNAGDNQIWVSWHDGLGYGAPGVDPYFAGNGTGAAVGDETTASYTEETIVYGGRQSMPLTYDNNKQGFAKYSEIEKTLDFPRDFTEEGVEELSIWFRGYPASVGSFIEGPVGTYTMTGSGADLWNVNGVEADEFHFAYKMLTGAGSIVAKVESVENTNAWAKAGVMIRESLEPESKHAFACVTPENGVASQGRPDTGAASFNTAQSGITAPHWVKLERDLAGNFTVSHSANGSAWEAVTGAMSQNIPMGANVYIGLALTSHDAALTCQAVFSNVTTTGSVGPQWTNQDIGIASNAAEPLYVALSNSAGAPAVVVHDDPAAATIDTWTEWVLPLQAFADQGIVLTNVDRIAIGLGDKGNTTIPGGSGKMFFDDIRLNRPEPEPQP